MSNTLNSESIISLSISNPADSQQILQLAHALSVPDRLKVLQCILQKSVSLAQIQKELDMPITSISRHVNALAEAGLISITYTPGVKGHTKYCTQAILGFTVSMESGAAQSPQKDYVIEMPVGMFSHCHISPPCGMLSATEKLIAYDDPSVFFSPQRMQAECLWFDRGFIDYDFPLPSNAHPCEELEFSFEVCSETNFYNSKWPSDITLFVNGLELATFTSPGDFGGRRGKYTPEFWPVISTQFGLLKTLKINRHGVFLDNALCNDQITLSDLDLYGHDTIRFKIGIKDTAKHIGGINLFGKNFGDFPQAIKMTVR